MRSWPSLTKVLNEACREGALSSREFERLLGDEHPGLLRQLEQDRRQFGRDRKWGASSNMDAGTGVPTVNPALLDSLAGFLDLPYDPEKAVAHAGMLHTYGYLLSNVRTPFGFKRARWTNRQMEKGLGLPSRFLSPDPPGSTLLRNLTQVMERCFEDELPNSRAGSSAPDWNGTDGGQWTLVEEPDELPCKLITRILTYPEDRAQPDSAAALFYAVRFQDRLEFVTAFPVAGWMISKLEKSARKSPRAIQPRYNAVVEGFENGSVSGNVSWIASPQAS